MSRDIDGCDQYKDSIIAQAVDAHERARYAAMADSLERQKRMKPETQQIYRVSLMGGEVDSVSISEAYKEATAGIDWAFRSAAEMFAPSLICGEEFPAVRQSKHYLYSPDKESLMRNAKRLGIGRVTQ